MPEQIALCPNEPLRDMQQANHLRTRYGLVFQRDRVHSREPVADVPEPMITPMCRVKIGYIVSARAESNQGCVAVVHRFNAFDQSCKPVLACTGCPRSDRVSKGLKNSIRALFVWSILADHGPDDKMNPFNPGFLPHNSVSKTEHRHKIHAQSLRPSPERIRNRPLSDPNEPAALPAHKAPDLKHRQLRAE